MAQGVYRKTLTLNPQQVKIKSCYSKRVSVLKLLIAKKVVIPAKAGIQCFWFWFPVFTVTASGSPGQAGG
jgi:hypothetical protein